MSNLKLFNSITDRSTIASAYSRICESEENVVKPDETRIPNEQTVKLPNVLDYLASKNPAISDDELFEIEDRIGKLMNADDSEEFVFTVTQSVPFHRENDGIGSYKFWGHDEYDVGHDYPAADDFGDTSSLEVPPGTRAICVSDEDEIQSEMDGKAEELGMDWEDEDGHGSYSSYEIPVRYTLEVTEPKEFDAWLGLSSDGNEGSDESAVGESIDDDDYEYAEEDDGENDEETGSSDEWEGRGRNIKWNYVDALKYTKSFMVIQKAVSEIERKLYDAQVADGEKKGRIFSELYQKLDDVRREADKWAPNEFLPGYSELMRDIDRLDGRYE